MADTRTEQETPDALVDDVQWAGVVARLLRTWPTAYENREQLSDLLEALGTNSSRTRALTPQEAEAAIADLHATKEDSWVPAAGEIKTRAFQLVRWRRERIEQHEGMLRSWVAQTRELSERAENPSTPAAGQWVELQDRHGERIGRVRLQTKDGAVDWANPIIEAHASRALLLEECNDRQPLPAPHRRTPEGEDGEA